MDELQVDRKQVADRPRAWQIVVRGELDAARVSQFEEMIDATVDAGARLVELDLTSVTFVDSSGLRAILHASRAVAAPGGRLYCTGLSAAAERVLELTGVLERLRPPDTPDPPSH